MWLHGINPVLTFSWSLGRAAEELTTLTPRCHFPQPEGNQEAAGRSHACPGHRSRPRARAAVGAVKYEAPTLHGIGVASWRTGQDMILMYPVRLLKDHLNPKSPPNGKQKVESGR
ncbi:Poly [ADP-ribose] polymerase 2 [Dissostichus eleginoides]|uniref:Poly [ADP-ribose] polymerase 2 n=1 Tax=Dissostichus eleginoides TaxID=100907 RepID=A0AAD9BJC9_DISEL|nr:Poly [ADP-ribose] polymerase 2 [Dissostichus eleginoides]